MILKMRYGKRMVLIPKKRKVTDKDLLYFGKVETERTYKHTSKGVLFNRPILKQIDELGKLPSPMERIKKLPS
jgi:hypothetical protein